MNIIISGCGKIGTTLVDALSSEGHDITVIDKDAKVIQEITNVYDVMGVVGNGTDCEPLEEANVSKARLFIAVTGSDELNMLSCYIARKMGAKHTIARIRNPEYNDDSLGFLRHHLNLSMAINPEMLAADEVFNVLKLPSASKIETFSKRNFELIEMVLKENSAIDGMKLSEIRAKRKENFLIGVVRRGDDVYIPDGNFVLKSGDRIGLMTSVADVARLLKSFAQTQKKARNIMILGASKTAYYLTKHLLNTGNNVTVIEKNLDRCEKFSEDLPKAVIIHGDGAQQELLLEEGLTSMDAFVSLTGMDEENILISYFASTQNVPKVISKVNRKELSVLSSRLGLDCIISPRNVVQDLVLKYVRALDNSRGSNIETLYKVMDGKAEAIEFNVRPELDFLGIPLKELNIKPNILVAGIIRGRKIIIPAGDDYISANDKVVVLSTDTGLQDLSDILL